MKHVSALGAAFVFLSAVGCSTAHYREAADRETYGLIAQRTDEVPGMSPDFTIEQTGILLEGLPLVTQKDAEAWPFLGQAAQAEVGANILSLEKALDIAVNNSRDYQSRKETLYLQALSLTEIRQRYRPVFAGHASGTYAVQTQDVSEVSGLGRVAETAPDLVVAIGNLTGAPADLLNAYADLVEASVELTGVTEPHVSVEEERSVSGTTSVGVSMLMRGGAQVAVGLTSNFLRFLTGDPRVSTSSALIASIEQPILGSERRTAAETLTQAERNLLYALRTFTRYRKGFSIDVASSYYRVLQSRDAVRNNWLGYEAFKKDLERAQAEADVGRKTKTDLGRTKEGELQARNRWVNAVRSYQNDLDKFKINLGLPVDAKVVLDPGELDRLMEQGPMDSPGFTLDDAVQVALAARLDYYTGRDRLDDAARQVKLAADGLKPDLSLALDAGVDSGADGDFNELDFKHYAWNLGLDLDPKLNRKSVRNRYRTALINGAAENRDFEDLGDNIKLGVRQAWRDLEQARISYEIQRNSLEESERRVLHQELLRELGEGKALDMIDAQNDRTRALNDLSTALVNHTTAYLRLWFEMGILYIKQNGQWETVTDVEKS